MKIGIDAGVLSVPLTGIGWYILRNLEEMLRRDTTQTYMLYSSYPPVVGLPAERVRVSLARPPLPSPGAFWRQYRLAGLVRHDRLDCFWGAFQILPVGLPSAIRTVVTIHDLIALLYPRTLTGYTALLQKLYARKSAIRADAIIAVSESTKRDIVSYFGVPESKVTVIYPGVAELFRPLPLERVRSRLQKIGIPNDYILSVGTVVPRRNYPLLMRAFSRLPPGPTLIIVGNSSRKALSTFQQHQNLEQPDRVRFLGYVPLDDLTVLYNGARLLVQPSLYEGFGSPVVEAMACGTPVLSSRSSSLPEAGGDAACYFDPRSEDSLYANLVELLGDETRLDRMRSKGVEHARRFTWRETAIRTLTVLTGGA